MKNYFGIDFGKQKEALLNCDTIKPAIEDVISKADSAIGKTYPALKMSEYMLFYETGDRSIYELKYFERRNDCAYLSAALWLTNNEKYLKPLIDIIYTICDEYTWCVPAHVHMEKNPSPDEIVGYADLFNGETARLLTEAVMANGDKLPCYVLERISYEIHRRVIDGFKNCRFFWWENATNNWAAVCANGIAAALLHFGTEEEINELLPRLYKAADNFLSGIEPDGCCKEGFEYWNFGFGYFVYFARLIYNFTNGKKNYFELNKVKNLAMFPQKIRMGKTKVYSVSDGSTDYKVSLGLLCVTRQIYGKEILYPELTLPLADGTIYSLKELLWFDKNYKADAYKAETSFFEDSEWYIKNGKRFSFAAKGGNNNEPHNHNDVGSFMIVNDDDIVIADLGRGEYRKGTFDSSVRYTMFVNGSQGHSVPIINGQHQLEGAQYKAKNVKGGENGFSLDIEGAYEKGLINKIHRCFEIGENSVTLTDSFIFSENTESICERLISPFKPQICDGYVLLGNARLIFDKNRYSVSFGEENYGTRLVLGKDGIRTAYYIDFTPASGLTDKFEIEIKAD